MGMSSKGQAFARRNDLRDARRAVTMLVGRDTQRMDAGACRRAVIESLAENTVDGFISPLFWYSLFGLPGVLLFKVVSTMDSSDGDSTRWCQGRIPVGVKRLRQEAYSADSSVRSGATGRSPQQSGLAIRAIPRPARRRILSRCAASSP